MSQQYPQADITAVTRTKVSRESGYDTTEVTVLFSDPVLEWSVRVNSDSALDGDLVESAQAEVTDAGFGQGRFGRMPFGRYVEDVVLIRGPVVVVVPATYLLEGGNDVAVYARGSGGWSYRSE